MDAYVRYSLLVVVLCLAPSGCRGPDSSIELLESELRGMEDQLYELDRQLSVHCAQLESCRRYNAALRQQLEESLRRPAARPATKAPPTSPPAAGNRTEPKRTAPRGTEPQIDDSDLNVPEIDYGPSQSPTPPPSTDSPKPNSLRSTPSPTTPAEGSDETLDEMLDEKTHKNPEADTTQVDQVDVGVSRIVLNSRLTGGYDFDGQPGDDGLLVVIEPQNASGQYLPLPGEVTIQVIDPARSGPASRVARWNYDVAETTSRMKKTLLGRGIHLQLPWPDQPPEASRLKLQVSYRAIEGQVLEAEREFRLDQGVRADSVAAADSVEAVATGVAARPVPWSATREPTLAASLLAGESLEPPVAPVDLETDLAPAAEPVPARRVPRASPAAPQIASPRTPLWKPYR